MNVNLRRIIEDEARKAEDRPFSKATAREALDAALANPSLALHAAFFLGRCSVSAILTDDELTERKQRLTKLAREAQADDAKVVAQFQNGVQKRLTIIDWRGKFRTGSELLRGELKQYIRGFLPEGVTGIGSLAGVGKTLLGLSMSRALRTSRPLVGVFEVTETLPVLYLVPEMGDRAIRTRLEKFKLIDDPDFRLWTMNDGRIALTDPAIEIMLRETHPAVFLDTAVRFNNSDDENAARQNSAGLAADIFNLISWGARAVVVLHHSRKDAAKDELMSLESMFRGTGDIGAMLDTAWGMRWARRRKGRKLDEEYLLESRDLTRLEVECLKPRDFEPVKPFRIQGRPFIDERGDFVVLVTEDALAQQIDRELTTDPSLSLRALMERLGKRASNNWIARKAMEAGWRKVGALWQKVRESVVEEEPEADNEDEQTAFDLEQDGESTG